MTGPRVRVRLTREGAPASALERVGPLTPYLTETIVEDAIAAGQGSRLEIELSAVEGAHVLRALRLSLDALAGRGIAVDVRAGVVTWASGRADSAA